MCLVFTLVTAERLGTDPGFTRLEKTELISKMGISFPLLSPMLVLAKRSPFFCQSAKFHLEATPNSRPFRFKFMSNGKASDACLFVLVDD